MHRPILNPGPVILIVALAALIAASPADAGDISVATTDTTRMVISALPAQCQAGDILTVELKVPVAGPAFNAYDAYVSYDPASLQFQPAANVSTQEGPLMTAACGLRFHVFQADTLAGRLRISHSLMCAGVSVTGPGVVYRVHFRCRNVNDDTRLTLLDAAPYRTTYFYAGIILMPLVTCDAVVRIGTGSTSGIAPPRVGLSDLRAAPNPFNPQTRIDFELDRVTLATLRVYDARGRLVATLLDGTLTEGTHSVPFDGHGLASGAYLCRLDAEGASITRKLMLVR